MTVYIVYARHHSGRPEKLAICLTLAWADVVLAAAARVYPQVWIEHSYADSGDLTLAHSDGM